MKDPNCIHTANYKGATLPQFPCFSCMTTYLERHADEPVTGRVLLAFMTAAKAELNKTTERACDSIAHRLASDPSDW